MFAAFAMLIFIHFCALITPGPDFFLVSQTAISRSHKEAVAVVGGITVGVMFWSLLALLGLNILFEKMAWLKHVLLVCGGLYLCWLGVQMLRSAFSKQQATTISPSVQVSKSMLSCFMKGMLTNLSNPKAVIYFGSVFSLFLTNPVLEHLHAVLFLVISAETAIWFLFVTFVFSLPACKAFYQRSVKWIDGISGGIFTLFGAFLITNK
ncbi:LysE family transporter [Acinetobacter brisouii]